MGYSLKWEAKGFHVQYSGMVTTDDIMDVIGKIQGDSRFDSLQYGISEYVNVTKYEITPEQFKIHIAYWNGSARSNLNLILSSVSSDPKIIPILQSMGNFKHKRQIFTSVEEARLWIKSETDKPKD